MRWKYDFLLEDEKIGEILVINDHKGEDVFSNIGIFWFYPKLFAWNCQESQMTSNH